MRALFFLPDDPALRTALDAELSRRPKTKRIQWAALGEDRAKGLVDALAAADRKHGFAIVDPPRSLDDLRAIDGACRARLGALPRAVFFAPPKKKEDPFVEFRAAMKDLYVHYHPSRRDLLFKKPRALPKTVKLAERTDSLIRWGAILPMTVIFAIFFLALVFLRDPLLHRGTIAGLEAAFGARAEVGGLSTTFHPSLELKSVHVADRRKPMKNLFEFDRLAGGVAIGPLFSGRLHMSELAIEGFRLGTDRTESGALSDPEANQPLLGPPAPGTVPDPLAPPADPTVPHAEPPRTIEQSLEDLVKKLEIPTPDDLESVRRGQQAEKEIRGREERLRRTLKESNVEDRIARAKDGLKGMKEATVPDSVRSTLDDVRKLKKDLKTLDTAQSDLDAVSKIGFDEEKKKIEAAKSEVEKAKETPKKVEDWLAKTKEIQKVKLTDIPKLLSLIKEGNALLKDVESSSKGLSDSAQSLEEAKSGIERKRKMGEEKLRSSESGIAGARSSLGGIGALAERAAQAKSDLDAQQKGVVDRFQGLKSEVEQGRKELEDLRKHIEEDVRYVSGLPGHMQEGVEIDRKKLMDRFNPENFSAEGLVRSVFGRPAGDWLHRALLAYRVLKPSLGGSSDKKPAKVKRKYGTLYHFPEPTGTPPRVWIKKASISGSHTIEGELFRIQGSAVNLTTDLAAVGEECRVDLTLEAGAKKISIHIRAIPKGELGVEVEVTGFTVRGRKIQNRHAPIDLSDGSLAVRAKVAFDSDGITAGSRAVLEGLKLTLAAEAEPRYAFLREFLAELAGLAVELDLRWQSDRLVRLDVRSDPFERLNGALRRALRREIAEAKEKARAKVDELTAGQLRDTDGIAKGFLGSARGEDQRLGGLLAGTEVGALPDFGKTFAEARKDLDLLSDPTVAQSPKRADALDAERGKVGSSLTKGASDNTSAADATRSLVDGEAKRLGDSQSSLKGEIDRLIKLKP